MLDFPRNIGQALGGDQDAYTRLHAALLPMAGFYVRRYPVLRRDAEELKYEAVAHVLLHLAQCPRWEYFIPWARKVMVRYYLIQIRDLLTLKNRIVMNAEPLDGPEYCGYEGDDKERQLEAARNHYQQLDAHIDATYVLSRLPVYMQDVSVRHAMFGEKQSAHGMMCHVRKAIRTGEYLARPIAHSFALPGIRM